MYFYTILETMHKLSLSLALSNVYILLLTLNSKTFTNVHTYNYIIPSLAKCKL